MSLDRTEFLGHVRTAGLAAIAAWVTILSWQVLTSGFGEVAWPLLSLAALLVLTGAVGRAAQAPALALVAVQVLASGLVVVGSIAGSVLPTPATWEAFSRALTQAADSARTYASPVPPEVPPVHPLLLAAGAAVLIVVSLCVTWLRQTPASGLVLLAAYAVPLFVTGGEVSWWVFVIAAAAFLAAVFAEHHERVIGWGRPAEQPGGSLSLLSGTLGNAALGLGSVAVLLATVVPLAIPTLQLSVFDGRGSGSGGNVEVTNPIADLRRDLTRGEDLPLLFVESEQNPRYLRLSVLNRFIDGRWTPGDRDIPTDQTATGEMPALDGVSLRLNRTESDYRVDVTSYFESTWLPTTAHVSSIDAGPEWRYDLDTRDFIAADDDTTTARLSYDFTGISVDYDATSMNDAVSGAAAVPGVFSDVPPSLDNEIRRLTESVTAAAPTRFQKAQALQQWFRVDGGFTYDLAQAESLGSGEADLRAFLDEDEGRVGYCEQFAAAMAIMARTLDIPARVAVGFLEPERLGPGSWQFSAWDLHAWPELYFPGSGWVRFEPTPNARASEVPGYTEREFEAPTEAPVPSATRTTEQSPERGTAPEIAQDTPDEDPSSLPWRPALSLLVALLLLAGVAAAPRWVRERRRRRRVAAGVEEMWQELSDVMVDVGQPLPSGRSPRRTASLVGAALASPVIDPDRVGRPRRGRDEAPEAAAALDRLVTAVERHRYARTGGEEATASLREDLGMVSQSLHAGTAPRERRRVQWLPGSVVGRQRQKG